jgi:RHS repeat-associated protein
VAANRGGWVDLFAYDGASRVTNTVQNGRSLRYMYDIPGRVQTNAYPSGRTVIYTYDARNRLATVRDTTLNPPIATYTYDAANRVMTRSYRNSTTASYTYHANDWVTSLEHSNTLNRIVGFGYAYDNEGNKLYEEKRHNPLDSEAYTYDALDRLTNYLVGTLVAPTVPSPLIQKAWNLDPVGNWDKVISNSIPEVRTHNTANELTSINTTNVLSHDDNGNLQQDTAYFYSYDEENRLTQVLRLSDSTIVGQYAYDALGRRVIKIGNPGGTPATNVFFYDGMRLIEELDAGVSTQATYTYGSYLDEVLTMDRGGQTYYFHQNALWSPQALTGSTGSGVERYIYDAYGQVIVLDASYNPISLNAWGAPHSAVANPWLFTGRQLDEETGLYYYRARYYDCIKGRFLTRDPLFDGVRDPVMIMVEALLSGREFIASEESTFNELLLNNLYAYVSGNPVNALDPSGLKPTKVRGAKAIADSAGKFKAL